MTQDTPYIFDATDATFQSARAQYDANLAQAELERAEALVSRGFISKADMDRKRATRDAANARVRVAQAQYAEALEGATFEPLQHAHHRCHSCEYCRLSAAQGRQADLGKLRL